MTTPARMATLIQQCSHSFETVGFNCPLVTTTMESLRAYRDRVTAARNLIEAWKTKNRTRAISPNKRKS